MIYLKQSTAADIMLGPFVDSTDGVTTEESLTLSQADLQLSKNCGTAAQKNESTSATHIYGGNYKIPLDATDTGTLGRLTLMCKKSGALPVKTDFMVIPAMIYDSMYAGTDRLDVNVTHIGDTAQTANDNGADINAILVDTDELQGNQGNWATATGFATAAALSTHDGKLDTVDGVVNAILLDTAEIGTAGAGLTAVPWNAAWDVEVQSECADALNAYDPPTKAEMDTGLAGLNDLSAAQVNAECDTALSDYAPPTKTEMDTAFAALNDLTAADIWDTASALTLDFGTLLERAYEMTSNKMTVVEADGSVALRNIGDSANVATGSVTSSSGTTTRDELSWT